jgi:hypothetical protein
MFWMNPDSPIEPNQTPQENKPEIPPQTTPEPVTPPAPFSEPKSEWVKEPLITVGPSDLKQIRTYQGDVANAIHNQKESIFSIHTAERARAEEKKAELTPEEKESRKQNLKTVAYFVGGILLLALAGAAGYLSYTRYIEKTSVPTVSIPENRLLPVVATDNIDTTKINRLDLIEKLRSERLARIPDGNVKHIELLKGDLETSPLMNPTEFMLLIGARPSGSLVRSFDPIFMLGIIGTPESASSSETFMLMKLDSYENAFAGMLAWEGTMQEDILPLFQDETVVASTTPGTGFRDVTIKNKDARVLADESGKTVLIYSFYNQNLLIITGNEDSLRTLINELDTQALSR